MSTIATIATLTVQNLPLQPFAAMRVAAGWPTGTAWKPAVAAMRVGAVEHVQDVIGGDTDPVVIALAIAADTQCSAMSTRSLVKL